jgi:DNA polymerase III subunit epsilon
MPRDWVAIDFETANERRNSVCALGLAVIRDGCIAEERSWLVRPPDLRFNFGNVMVHGIRPADVEDAPEFCEIWDDVLPFLIETAAIAHNAGFDKGVLRAVLDTYGLEWPDAEWFCTLAMARAAWPQLPNHRLDSVAAHCGFDFRHHDAGEDARACAAVALGCQAHLGAQDLEDAAARLGIAGRGL